MFCIPVNSYGHVETVCSRDHTFFLGKLDYVVNQYFLHILSLVTDLNQGKEENDTKVWEPVGIKLATPGSAVGLATDCATGLFALLLAILTSTFEI